MLTKFKAFSVFDKYWTSLVLFICNTLDGCCAYAHQQWCTVRSSTPRRVILVERKLYTVLCEKSHPSTLYSEAAEGADFPSLTLILWAWQLGGVV